LEPDARLGHAWLEATRTALAPARTPPHPSRPCAVIHAWYPEVFAELLQALQASGLSWRLVITTTHERRAEIEQLLATHSMQGEIHAFANHGRDILPFLHVAETLLEEGEDIVLKLHTKRSTHRHDGDQWRNEIVDRLLAPERAARIVDAFNADPALGLVPPEGHVQRLDYFWGANERNVRSLLTRFGLPQADTSKDCFIAGSMFWLRLAALRPMLDTHLQPSLFETEAGQVDGTLAHAIERTFTLVARHAGFVQKDAATLLGLAHNDDTPYAYAKRS
jgi:lipopolysaccharide biosynthesis protein